MGSLNDALEIIKSVAATADNVCLNKNQCKRLAERFGQIGEALKALELHDVDGNFDVTDKSEMESSAFDQILTLLKKGEALVASYKDPGIALPTVLGRAENPEAFKEIHDDINSLRMYLSLPDNVGEIELSSSEVRKDELLAIDADSDREEMLSELHSLKLEDIPVSSESMVDRAEVDVNTVESVVSGKCKPAADINADCLPTYLCVTFSVVTLLEPIKELPPESKRSKGDAHLEGLALVHRGRWLGCECAIKVFKSSEFDWNKDQLRTEVASLVKLKHPHITQLIGFAQNDEKTYVLYEKMDSDLRHLIDSRPKSTFYYPTRPFSRTEEVNIITQIARGMFYLHRQGYIHGELKCSNLLIKQVGGHIDVKISDFHCSRQLGMTPTNKWKPSHRPRWSPPEAIQNYDNKEPSEDDLQKSDVYSFGMTCYEVVTGNLPFQNVRGNAVMKKVIADERPVLPSDLSEELRGLIEKCWDPEPCKRPSFENLCYVLMVSAVKISCIQKLLLCFDPPEEKLLDNHAELNWIDNLGLEHNQEKSISEKQFSEVTTQDLPKYLAIDPMDLKPVRRLGRGSSAVVYEASWIGCKFAVKWFKSEHVSELQQEIDMLMKLLHPHVVRLVGFSVLLNRCGMVMEVMDCSLRDYLVSKPKGKPNSTTPPEVLDIITKLALGMEFLHSRDVTHGDLKGANVLVRHVQTGSKLDVKIVDFGLSQFMDQGPTLKRSSTGWWRAPEVILNSEIKPPKPIDLKAADVYSFGMTCYEVITTKTPFQEHSYNLARQLAVGGGRPKLDHVKMVEGLGSLLHDCWELDPEKRPKFSDICERLLLISKRSKGTNK